MFKSNFDLVAFNGIGLFIKELSPEGDWKITPALLLKTANMIAWYAVNIYKRV